MRQISHFELDQPFFTTWINSGYEAMVFGIAKAPASNASGFPPKVAMERLLLLAALKLDSWYPKGLMAASLVA